MRQTRTATVYTLVANVLLLTTFACGSNSTGASIASPAAATSPSRQASRTPSPQVNPRLAEIDAAIRQADPDGVLTPILDCINQAANANPELWNGQDGMRHFAELVQAAAKACGVTVAIIVTPNGTYFRKPT